MASVFAASWATFTAWDAIEPWIDLRPLELERGYQPLIALLLGGLELQVMDPIRHGVRFGHFID